MKPRLQLSTGAKSAKAHTQELTRQIWFCLKSSYVSLQRESECGSRTETETHSRGYISGFGGGLATLNTAGGFITWRCYTRSVYNCYNYDEKMRRWGYRLLRRRQSSFLSFAFGRIMYYYEGEPTTERPRARRALRSLRLEVALK